MRTRRQATTTGGPADFDGFAEAGFSLFALRLIALIVACGIVAPIAAWAQPTTAIVTGTERVFVRRGPGNEFPPFASIPSGSTVEVQDMQGEWARIITASGQVGYISSNFLALPGEYERRPTPVRPTFTHPPTRTPHRPTPTRPQATATQPHPTSTPAPATATRPLVIPTTTAAGATTTPTFTAARHTPTAPRSTLTPTFSPTRPLPTASATVAKAGSEAHGIPLEPGTEGLIAGTAANPLGGGAICTDEQVRMELARLTNAVEHIERRLDAASNRVDDPQFPPAAGADSSRNPSPIAVFLGMVGVIIGWVLGSSYARRQERSRRSRLRL